MRKRKERARHGRQPKWPVMAASMDPCSRSPFCHGCFLSFRLAIFQRNIGVNDSQRVDLTDLPPYVMASGQKKTRPIPADAWHTCVEEDARWPEGASRKDTRLTYHPVEEKKNLRKEKRSSSSASGHLGTRKKKKKFCSAHLSIIYINHVSYVSPVLTQWWIPGCLPGAVCITDPTARSYNHTPLCWPWACPGDEDSREVEAKKKHNMVADLIIDAPRGGNINTSSVSADRKWKADLGSSRCTISSGSKGHDSQRIFSTGMPAIYVRSGRQKETLGAFESYSVVA